MSSMLNQARELDQKDPLSKMRESFYIPKQKNGEDQLYFAGHSLGLMPKKAQNYIDEELDAWKRLGVEGHFHAKHPWLPYHENITKSFAHLVGGKESEVVAMNTLTVNLHLMLVSFYRPTKNKYKILIENNTFPSDKYAVDSQARFHGYDPKDAILELQPNSGEITVSEDSVLEQIEKNSDSLALIMLGNCNYLSGQRFDFEKIVKLAHSKNILVGFNLAHGAGNLHLKLHDWNVDFAVWCSYKYLNSGPGGLAGAFVHKNHHGQKDIPRFEGWWGHDKNSRFKMGPNFEPIATVEAWQLSNPPIFQLASLRASMELFDQAGMENLRSRGDRLTNFFESHLKERVGEYCKVISPASSRGSMLCIRYAKNPKELYAKLTERGAIVDFREPDILRMTPAPLYNSFEDISKLVTLIEDVSND